MKSLMMRCVAKVRSLWGEKRSGVVRSLDDVLVLTLCPSRTSDEARVDVFVDDIHASDRALYFPKYWALRKWCDTHRLYLHYEVNGRRVDIRRVEIVDVGES